MLGSFQDEAFKAYRRTPTSELLSGLVSLHQESAYNICYQVLRSREDAEDAAQESLIKVVGCLDRIESPNALRHWLYRICLTQALDLNRRRRRRQNHESRYAMTEAPFSPQYNDSEEEKRTVLFQALERIDDDQRSLVVEHYFERTPLTRIAAREGISNEAIWKRIDRARRSLKDTLGSMGMAALVPDPISVLESCHPAALITNLVPAVLKHSAASPPGAFQAVPSELCQGTLAAAPKALALGGIVMAVKLSTWTTVVVTALIATGITVAGVLMSRAPRASETVATVFPQHVTPRTASGVTDPIPSRQSKAGAPEEEMVDSGLPPDLEELLKLTAAQAAEIYKVMTHWNTKLGEMNQKAVNDIHTASKENLPALLEVWRQQFVALKNSRTGHFNKVFTVEQEAIYLAYRDKQFQIWLDDKIALYCVIAKLALSATEDQLALIKPLVRTTYDQVTSGGNLLPSDDQRRVARQLLQQQILPLLEPGQIEKLTYYEATLDGIW